MALLLLFAAPTATAAAAVPVNQVAPSFSGLPPQEGELLTADPGTWTGSPTSYQYQWFSCGSAYCADIVLIAGATEQTYRPGAEQVGRRVGVGVIATNADGDSAVAVALLEEPTLIAYPRIVTYPTVTGTPREGETLTANRGSWTPTPDSYSYQWYGCNAARTVCDLIPGATAQTYRVGPSDVGRRLIVGVVASNAGGPSDEEFSDLTEPVLAAPASGTNPSAPGGGTPAGGTPPQVASTPAPGSALASPFATLRRFARSDGRLEFSVRVRGAGRLTARATAGAALLARGCVAPCKRTGLAEFGTASLTTSAAGVVKLVVKPSARAARALRRSRRLPVRVRLTFRPADGATAISRTYSLTVNGALARRGATAASAALSATSSPAR
jgi:hypothetical protein